MNANCTTNLNFVASAVPPISRGSQNYKVGHITAKMNFLRQGFRNLSSDRQTDRRVTEYDVASRAVNYETSLIQRTKRIGLKNG